MSCFSLGKLLVSLFNKVFDVNTALSGGRGLHSTLEHATNNITKRFLSQVLKEVVGCLLFT